MKQQKTLYTSSERSEAKSFLEISRAVRTELDSERHAAWLAVDGCVWTEYDDPPFYTLFLKKLGDTSELECT